MKLQRIGGRVDSIAKIHGEYLCNRAAAIKIDYRAVSFSKRIGGRSSGLRGAGLDIPPCLIVVVPNTGASNGTALIHGGSPYIFIGSIGIVQKRQGEKYGRKQGQQFFHDY
ncbi:hypothetical protein OH491_06360 [Termitidicoccus mucosus]|uniref:hypothetical protein n=1 Tax=Termitidicoccus mucosus TaxID=1184151 RepID=UPI002FEDF05D